MKNEIYMAGALAEARLAMGRTHPNPAVGAVIVQDGEIVARGHTQPAGRNHAEIEALVAFKASGLKPDASTVLYVTMEPCSTSGRTGACTDAILGSGIGKIVIGTTDPNPKHQGKGFSILEQGGIEVESGLLDRECEDLNLIFNWRMKHDRPFIAAKVATTIDGKIATRGGLSKWITGPKARADVHRWRRYFPAIAVGAGTVIADDPSLTARVDGEDKWCPVRFVFDRNLITFKDDSFKVYSDEWKDRTIVVTSAEHSSRVAGLEAKTGVRFWPIDDNFDDGGFGEFCQRCEAGNIDGIFVEGGASLVSSMLKYRFIHYLFAYRAPRILADASGLAPFMGQEPFNMDDAIRLARVRHATFDDDQLMRGFIVYPEK